MSALREAPEALTDAQALSVEAPVGRPTGQWGMFLFVATEATFFACLLASYFYVRFSHGGAWPPDGISDPKLLKPAIMTALLLLSSGPMIVADHAIRHGRPRLTAAMMPITVLLGLAFLALQSSEYCREAQGVHAADGLLRLAVLRHHRLPRPARRIGLVMVTVTEIAALMGKFTAGRHERVRMVSIYWHFVDVVWIAIVASLYLAPHLRG